MIDCIQGNNTEERTVDMCEAIDAIVRKKVNTAKKETEIRVRKETETESLRNAFAMILRANPSLSEDEAYRIISDTYRVSVKNIRKAIAS